MKISDLQDWASNKERFLELDDYLNFAEEFLNFREDGNLQAELVARNTPTYRFFQYGEEADYLISRPVNSSLFYSIDDFLLARADFNNALGLISDGNIEITFGQREALKRVIYTAQQSIGVVLDSHGNGNLAKKINGDLFERFILLTIHGCGVQCRSGVLRVAVNDEQGVEQFKMNYQHDLMVEKDGELKAIGSVKTSSKDRMDKVFVDKFLYNRLTGISIPHFAIFLHDVQRKGKQPNYNTSKTFLPGHFKGYTVKLNPLDGVYYCDLLPDMEADPLLSRYISSIDRFFAEDLPAFVHQDGASDVEVKTEKLN